MKNNKSLEISNLKGKEFVKELLRRQQIIKENIQNGGSREDLLKEGIIPVTPV